MNSCILFSFIYTEECIIHKKILNHPKFYSLVFFFFLYSFKEKLCLCKKFNKNLRNPYSQFTRSNNSFVRFEIRIFNSTILEENHHNLYLRISKNSTMLYADYVVQKLIPFTIFF